MSDERTFIERFVDEITGSAFPWVARIYLLLIVLIGITLIGITIGAHHVAQPIKDDDLYLKLFALLSDALKTVVGGLLGSLSLAAEALWRNKSE